MQPVNRQKQLWLPLPIKQGMPKTELSIQNPRIGEAPFDSMRKMMSTIHQTDHGIVQYTKGAPDIVLSLCTSYLENDGICQADDRRKEKRDPGR
jgi:Ca2+-transporting ATPase